MWRTQWYETLKSEYWKCEMKKFRVFWVGAGAILCTQKDNTSSRHIISSTGIVCACLGCAPTATTVRHSVLSERRRDAVHAVPETSFGTKHQETIVNTKRSCRLFNDGVLKQKLAMWVVCKISGDINSNSCLKSSWDSKQMNGKKSNENCKPKKFITFLLYCIACVPAYICALPVRVCGLCNHMIVIHQRGYTRRT